MTALRSISSVSPSSAAPLSAASSAAASSAVSSPAVDAEVARAVTRPVAPVPGPVFAAVPDTTDVLAMVHHGGGLVGWGSYAEFSATGPSAAADIQRWFTELTRDLTIDDPLGFGGPIAFVSLGFDATDESVAVVPRVLLGRRDDVSYCTVIDAADATVAGSFDDLVADARRQAPELRPPGAVAYSDATLSVGGYTEAVAAATARIRAGELAKVVLSHDLTATTEHPVDERFLLDALAGAYPTCWTFAVRGLIGASPEMLVRRTGRRVLSRVLAGTGWAEHTDDQVVADLLASSKDQEEHRYAAESVAAALREVCSSLHAPEQPRPLVLANLTHLATDVTGELAEPAPTALELAALLHPTPAVGGTPTQLALQAIRELEPGPRGRYAAPVGWLDSRGDGEFALALRCAEVKGRTVRMIAGGGIVADSKPEIEAREVQVKMIPVRDALES